MVIWDYTCIMDRVASGGKASAGWVFHRIATRHKKLHGSFAVAHGVIPSAG
jgi:hypothetical protein